MPSVVLCFSDDGSTKRVNERLHAVMCFICFTLVYFPADFFFSNRIPKLSSLGGLHSYNAGQCAFLKGKL